MGKYIWLDGTIYEGEWEKSKMTGKGRISWPSGAKYEGDFCGGFIHGSGTFSGPDGSIYTGPWLMNKQNGHGRKSYSNLDVYEGSWKEGIQEGIGRYVWSNGNAYIGNWKGGKMCGRGVMKWVNGNLFDGFWQDGLEHGSGYYKFADGGFYFGTWSRGLKDGRGTFFPAGSRLPPVKRWYDSVGYFDGQQSRLHCTTRLSSSEELQNGKPRARSTGSDRRSISNFFKGSGRISHQSTSLNGLWSFHDFLGELPLQESDVMSSSSLDEGQPSPKDENVTVYERDYMQGILMMERIRDKRLSKKSKWLRKCKEKEGTKPGETIIKGHKSYHLMLNLQLGIRYSVGKITPVPVRQVRSSDFGPQARIRMHFPKEDSIFHCFFNQCILNDMLENDESFRNLREMFKIDAADYMMSICGCDGLKELSSPGKSGSIFYLSQDERFVIKTLKKPELKILLKMLPKYYNHVESHDNTLITKFFGLHQIKLKGGHKPYLNELR
ncbi:Phosphatidylinositol 4-phosphate 5-kinase 1 [Acorus gramineus]|uniref:1-phosphatidylinositol-4-phosphate 5-kinase n=1 Tax=Acorus gramineus TaxID=55184 RepID=A0AAV9AFI0_ACOGR|nr:Phosphatidylinositol 4-phosphate 5-kinase 1 [Acorus gramineus]